MLKIITHDPITTATSHCHPWFRPASIRELFLRRKLSLEGRLRHITGQRLSEEFQSQCLLCSQQLLDSLELGANDGPYVACIDRFDVVKAGDCGRPDKGF